jgi:hypothetical protein
LNRTYNIQQKNSENGKSIYIDLNYEAAVFTKEFALVDTRKYKDDPKVEWLPCFEAVPVEFLNKVDPALTEIESFIKRTHRGEFSFEAVATDPTLRCIYIQVGNPSTKQTLWLMRENPSEKTFTITCKTLYEVKSI